MADYGATVAGVTALTGPSVPITPTSVPSEEQVEGWLAEFNGTVDRRLGDLTAFDAAAEAAFIVAGRRLIHLAVAAYVEDAAHPERSSKGDTRYGAVLWDRYLAGLDELVEEVDTLREEVEDEAAEAPGGPGGIAHSFPPPMFRRGAGF